MALLALGVGTLQIMLDKGQEEDWFGSHFISTLAILAAVGLVSLVIWEWFHKDPIIDVRLFKNLNFLGANFMIFVLGIMLFSSLFSLPREVAKEPAWGWIRFRGLSGTITEKFA